MSNNCYLDLLKVYFRCEYTLIALPDREGKHETVSLCYKQHSRMGQYFRSSQTQGVKNIIGSRFIIWGGSRSINCYPDLVEV
jgi:hypothetical protein